MFGEKCYVIAEIGNNHCGDIDLCIKTIEEAKICGASAVKLQKRSNKDLFTKKFLIHLMKIQIHTILMENIENS